MVIKHLDFSAIEQGNDSIDGGSLIAKVGEGISGFVYAIDFCVKDGSAAVAADKKPYIFAGLIFKYPAQSLQRCFGGDGCEMKFGNSWVDLGDLHCRLI